MRGRIFRKCVRRRTFLTNQAWNAFNWETRWNCAKASEWKVLADWQKGVAKYGMYAQIICVSWVSCTWVNAYDEWMHGVYVCFLFFVLFVCYRGIQYTYSWKNLLLFRHSDLSGTILWNCTLSVVHICSWFTITDVMKKSRCVLNRSLIIRAFSVYVFVSHYKD